MEHSIINSQSKDKGVEVRSLIPKEAKKRFQKWSYPVVIGFAISSAIIVTGISLYFWSPGPSPVVPTVTDWEQKGMTFTNGKYCPWVRFGSAKANLSMSNLASTGANYVAIVVTQFQDTINTTTIYNTSLTATDEELTVIIGTAHELGLKVMLKPHIDLYIDPTHWRGDIGTYFTEAEWNQWFDSYNQFIVHYAALAETLQVEQFSLGCELINTSPQESQWRQIASAVKNVYTGKITYAANWGGEETNKTWWDVVDFIGVDAYYPLCPDIVNASVSDLVNCWNEIIYQGVANGIDGWYMSTSLQNLSVYWNKPLIFTEIGFCSGDCIYGPNVDILYQLFRYESVFQAFRELNWFKGVYWWNWVSDPAFGGEDNYCCTPQFKKTEHLLRKEYGGFQDSVIPDYPPDCPCIL